MVQFPELGLQHAGRLCPPLLRRVAMVAQITPVECAARHLVRGNADVVALHQGAQKGLRAQSSQHCTDGACQPGVRRLGALERWSARRPLSIEVADHQAKMSH